MEQKYTSANTSINSTKLPKIYGLVKELQDESVTAIDYGCGKFFDKYVDQVKCKISGYDKYNRPDKNVLKRKFDVAICSNVLNVIAESEVRNDVARQLKDLADVTYITVYEGNGSGIGKESKEDCYQLNRKVKDYVHELKTVFNTVEIKNGVIKCA